MFAYRRLGSALGWVMSVGLLTACQADTDTQSKTNTSNIAQPSEYLDSAIPADAPSYLVGTMGSYAPFEFRDENGQSIGFDMDIMYAIAAKQKFHVTVLTHPWEGILNTLNTGERDIIISTVNMTPEREQQYEFTYPYFTMRDTFLVKTSNTEIKQYQDLVSKQRKVAALAGSSQKEMTIQHGVPAENIVTRDSQFLALKEMFADNADAVIGDGAVMDYFALTYEDIPTHSFTLPDAPLVNIGIAVKKGNSKLRDQLNTGLKQIYADGTYDKIYFKWFKKPVPNNFLPWTSGTLEG